MFNPILPNLGVLSYMAKQYLSNDESFMEKYNENSQIKFFYRGIDFDVKMFSQTWGNTATGFDIDKDGVPTLGGCAMTKEYTTVFHETVTDTFLVFFGERICYMVTDPTDAFYEDYSACNMASLSEAKRRY